MMQLVGAECHLPGSRRHPMEQSMSRGPDPGDVDEAVRLGLVLITPLLTSVLESSVISFSEHEWSLRSSVGGGGKRGGGGGEGGEGGGRRGGGGGGGGKGERKGEGGGGKEEGEGEGGGGGGGRERGEEEGGGRGEGGGRKVERGEEEERVRNIGGDGRRRLDHLGGIRRARLTPQTGSLWMSRSAWPSWSCWTR